jgi:hypothetical protein
MKEAVIIFLIRITILCILIIGCKSTIFCQSRNQPGKNYPGPFSPNSKLSFEVKSKQMVTVAVYDTLGKKLGVLVNDTLSQGWHYTEFDTSYSVGYYDIKYIYRDTTFMQRVYFLK